MTSKERMMCAINRGTPDRLPVTIHQWQPYHLNEFMNKMSDIEANRYCGFDASINVYSVTGEESNAWRISSKVSQKEGYYLTDYQIDTPEGTLTTSVGTNPMTSWVMDHLIKNEEDIHLVRKYRPIPKLNKKLVYDTYDELGDDGIIRTFIWGKQGGCWQDACELFGVENLILQTFDNEEWVSEFLGILLHQKLEYIEQNFPGMPFDLVETGGGASSNTVISPDIHKKFCLPFDQRIHDVLRKYGFKSVYHTCGGMTKIAELIAENHCDVSETLSPDSVGGDIRNEEDAKLIYNTLHPRVGLIGGMDQFNLLEKGSKKEIEEGVIKLFEEYGKDGGYIMSACDHFFNAPPQNLKYFSEAAKQIAYS